MRRACATVECVFHDDSLRGGDFRESTHSVRVAARTGHPRPSGRGFRRCGRYRGCVCSWCGEDFGQTGSAPAGCGPFTRSVTAYAWRISAGYSTGGYPPVDRMPHTATNMWLTRRNIRHNCPGCVFRNCRCAVCCRLSPLWACQAVDPRGAPRHGRYGKALKSLGRHPSGKE